MNMFSQSIEQIEKQLNEFKSVINDLDNNSNVDKDYHTMHVLASRRKVCEFATSLYNTEYKLKQMLNQIDSMKQDVNNAVDVVNEYTKGKEKENVNLVCSKMPIKTLTEAHILDHVFTPSEVCYMVNKKLTKKIISKLEFNDLSYIAESLGNEVEKLTDKKRDILYKSLADLFLENEIGRNRYDIDVKRKQEIAKNMLNINGMPDEVMEYVYDKLKSYCVLYTMKNDQKK